MGRNLGSLLKAAALSGGTGVAGAAGPVRGLARAAALHSLISAGSRRNAGFVANALKAVGLGAVHWPTFAAGAAAAAVAPTVARPVLKTLVKAGATVPLTVGEAWSEAKTEHEARRLAEDPTLSLHLQLQELRAELEAVKADLAKAKSSK